MSPGVHKVQVVLPYPLYRPLEQLLHVTVELAEVVPLPGWQLIHGVLGLESSSTLPAEQAVQLDDRAREYRPMLHDVQPVLAF